MTGMEMKKKIHHLHSVCEVATWGRDMAAANATVASSVQA